MDIDLEDLRIDHGQERPARRAPGRIWMVLFFLLLAVSAGAIYYLWRYPPQATTTVNATTPEPAQANTPPPIQRREEGSFSAAGWIKLPRTFPIEITPLVAGRLEQIAVIEGDPVAPDQLIATLYAGDFKAAHAATVARVEATAAALAKFRAGYRPQEVAEALAEVTRLEAELKTAREVLAHSRELLPSGAIPLEELQRDETRVASLAANLTKARERHALFVEGFRSEEIDLAEAEHAEALAQRNLAKLQIDYAVIRSPIKGVVLERRTVQGQWITPRGGAIVSLFDPAQLEARVDVNQSDLAKVYEGQKVEITTRAEPGRVRTGTVHLIEPQADLVKNTVAVRVQIDAATGRMLHPDMVVKARFLARPEDASTAATGQD